MASKNVTIRMEEELRKDAEQLFEQLGMTLSGAITVFLKQAVREQAIPFEIQMNPQSRNQEKKSLNRLLAYLEKMNEMQKERE